MPCGCQGSQWTPPSAAQRNAQQQQSVKPVKERRVRDPALNFWTGPKKKAETNA